jgi:hypothetical protein
MLVCFSYNLHCMSRIQRSSLPDQAADILRQGISSARWSRELPSEAALCRELHVSRATLRAALARLIRERWLVAGGRGRHHRIRRKPATRVVSTGRIVRALSPYSLAGMGAINHVLLDHLAERIGGEGYRLEFESHPGLFQRHQPSKLRSLDSLPDTAAWLLFYSTEPVQRWFAAGGRPCIVMGRLHPGMQLPCIYPDTEAAMRHAAGLFCARGHRELAYLTDLTSLGDRLGAEAFVAAAQRLGARARIVAHLSETADVRRTLSDLLAQRPRPNGFVVGASENSITALCHFLNAGLRVPTDAALIAAWDDPHLRCTVPTIACYQIDGAKFGRKAATLLLDLLKHGPGKSQSVRVMPEFIPGESLGSVIRNAIRK